MRTCGPAFMTMVLAFCVSASGCQTFNSADDKSISEAVGNFELTPTAPNQYWFGSNTYDYNKYRIKITSEPVTAKIMVNGKQVGSTPYLYEFTGKLDKDDYLIFQAVPFDDALKTGTITCNGGRPLPRAIAFDLTEKK